MDEVPGLTTVWGHGLTGFTLGLWASKEQGWV